MDVAAQRTLEDLAHAAQVRAEVDDFGIDRPAPRERQQVAGQTGTARDRAAHAVVDALALLGADVALENLQAVGEDRQQVVEVVRDSTGQLADRLHLLGMTQCLFGMAQALLVAHTLGDVVDELVGADAVARAVAQGVVTHLVRAAIA